MKNSDTIFMKQAIELSQKNIESGRGGPFGCVIVKDGVVIGQGANGVTSLNDPTAHAEIQAIRDACTKLGDFQLQGCTIYTSCEPCPMCLGAIYRARPARVVYANTKTDAAAIDFDDDFIYQELKLTDYGARSIPFEHIHSQEALDVFVAWKEKDDKIEY